MGTATNTVNRFCAPTMSSEKEPSGLARMCGPLLRTAPTSTQHPASASTMDHHEQLQGKTWMRRVVGPGASNGASTGQEATCVLRRALVTITVAHPPTADTNLMGTVIRAVAWAAIPAEPNGRGVYRIDAVGTVPASMPNPPRRPGGRISTAEVPSV
jgi:hypothetical protein